MGVMNAKYEYNLCVRRPANRIPLCTFSCIRSL